MTGPDADGKEHLGGPPDEGVVVGGVSAVPQRERGAVALPHMPALDGLRGLAVLLVVGVHLWIYFGRRRGAPDWLGWFSGGSLGVDVFFVLSGALITSLLLAEHRRTGGISIKKFYERRARRLGPALVVALLLALLVWLATDLGLGPDPGLSVASVVFFFSNWVKAFDHQALGMLAPAWSLAVEEQFYLTWPLLLGFLMRRGARPIPVVTGLLLTVLLCQAYVVISLEHVDDVRTIYFQPFIGAMGLLLGCALAIHVAYQPTGRVVRLLGNVWVAAAAFAGAVALVVAARRDRGQVRAEELAGLGGAGDWLFRGGYLAVMALSAVVIGHVLVRALNPSAVSRALSFKPLTLTGLVSYGMYLFHVPIIVMVGRKQTTPVMRQIIISLVLIAALSAVSYYLVEKPIRERRGRAVRAGPPQEPVRTE